jgi:cytidyltransferase-like protein
MTNTPNIIVLSGGFDPIHAGHVAMIREAERLGHWLIIGLNSDAWLARKKGAAFMPWYHRAEVLRSINGVKEVLSFDDSDGSACDLLEKVKKQFPTREITFVNGGDRTDQNIPEMSVEGIKFVFGIGGFDKRGSSSDFLRDWKEPKTARPWGEYRVIYNQGNLGRCTKVKELTVMPGKSLSMQRHKLRNEFWHVVEGMCDVHTALSSGYALPPRTLSTHDRIDVPVNEWHRLTNPYSTPCRIVEIQFGEDCDESDIERK